MDKGPVLMMDGDMATKQRGEVKATGINGSLAEGVPDSSFFLK